MTLYGNVKSVDITSEMEKSYLDYAMSVIVARALPDARDGLKPVHRRILYAMKSMGLTHSSSYKKCARIVGDVLGKYHPHGDSAVYDALVRLAQDFSMRYPLVDGQGNFGSVDGDSAAQMRYTEAKLTKISEELLSDLDKDTVEFVENFDGSETEPKVLPSLLPNLLLMGADGIAVGMATKIPPHNLSEVVNAAIALLQKGKVEQEKAVSDIENADPIDVVGEFSSDSTVEELLQYIKGPDFPTAGMIFDKEAIHDVYTTGKGKIIVRGTAEIVETKTGKMRILIDELPYQVNKANLIAKVATLVRNKKIVGISDLRDESDRSGMRIVIELKRDAKPRAVLNNLYKFTQLQDSFPANMVALNHEGTPQVMTLKMMLTEYVRHRQLVVVRRSQFELREARARAHILEGLIIALDNLDAVIETIRKSPDADVAKVRLMKKFKLSDVQSQAILDMQLRRLAALERKKIQDEYKKIKDNIDKLLALLGSPAKILKVIEKELVDLNEIFGDERRTKVIPGKLEEFSEKDFVPAEEALITVTESGYIKRMPIGTYRSQRRGGKGVTGMSTKLEDTIALLFTANTHDNVLFFTDKGKVYKIAAHEIPQGSRQAKGQAVINLINIEQNEKVQGILPISHDLKNAKDKFLLFVTRNGMVKKSRLQQYHNIKANGLIAITLTNEDELVWVQISDGNQHILLVTREGKSIRFAENQVRATARDTMGVRGIRKNKTDMVVDVIAFNQEKKQPQDKRRKYFRDILIVTKNGMGKRTAVQEHPPQKRGGMGVKVANLSTKTGNIARALFVNQSTDQIIITSDQAQVIKLPLKNIPRLKRPTQGVILMRFAKSGDKVAAVVALEKE